MLRVGSIGLGGISNGVHVPGIKESADLKLVAICDIDEAKLKAKAEEYGIPADHCFTDYHDLVNCPDVDIVDISTPNDFHAEMAIYAAEQKKNFCVEKPITLNLAEAEAIQKAVDENGVQGMVCFSYRYKAAARYAKALIESGKLGKIYHINAQYYQAWGLPDKNTKLVWRFVKERTGTGALGDLGCHVLDLVTFMTGEEYTKVVAHHKTFVHEREKLDGSGMGTVDVDDQSDYLCETANGAACSFQISRFTAGRGNYQRVEIYGEKGAFVYSLDALHDGIDTLDYFDESDPDKQYVRLEIPDEYKVSQMQCFSDMMHGHGDGKNATIADGVKSQKILDALCKSAEEGRWVEI